MSRHGLLASALVVAGLFGLFVFAQSFATQEQLVTAQRAECLRGIHDRETLINATWSVANTPLTDGNRPLEKQLAISDALLVEPREAWTLPAALRRYAHFSCVRAYPSVSLWPW